VPQKWDGAGTATGGNRENGDVLHPTWCGTRPLLPRNCKRRWNLRNATVRSESSKFRVPSSKLKIRRSQSLTWNSEPGTWNPSDGKAQRVRQAASQETCPALRCWRPSEGKGGLVACFVDRGAGSS